MALNVIMRSGHKDRHLGEPQEDCGSEKQELTGKLELQEGSLALVVWKDLWLQVVDLLGL